MAIIYHITTKQKYAHAKEKGFYQAPSLCNEWFVHCSKEEQVKGVLERYYAGQKNLVKLSIDTDKLKVPVHYELAPSVNEEFPHVYGLINLDAIVAVEEIN